LEKCIEKHNESCQKIFKQRVPSGGKTEPPGMESVEELEKGVEKLVNSPTRIYPTTMVTERSSNVTTTWTKQAATYQVKTRTTSETVVARSNEAAIIVVRTRRTPLEERSKFVHKPYKGKFPGTMGMP